MPDFATITAAVKSLKTATDIAKFLKDSDLTIEKAEIKLQLADLISSLADAKLQTADVQNLLIEKDQQIKSLNKQLKTKGSIKYDAPYYWMIDGESKDGPFCQRCYEHKNENILVRLQERDQGYWECKVCENHYTDASYSPEPLAYISNSNSSIDWNGY